MAVTAGATALRQWIQDNGLSIPRFCERFGLDRIAVQRAVNGERKRTSVDFALGVERATGGAVTAAMWSSDTNPATAISPGAEALRVFAMRVGQREFARRLSARLGRRVHQGTISTWATGRSVPRGEYLVAISLETGIRVESWAVTLPRRLPRVRLKAKSMVSIIRRVELPRPPMWGSP